jgi:hypothetical protein
MYSCHLGVRCSPKFVLPASPVTNYQPTVLSMISYLLEEIKRRRTVSLEKLIDEYSSLIPVDSVPSSADMDARAPKDHAEKIRRAIQVSECVFILCVFVW